MSVWLYHSHSYLLTLQFLCVQMCGDVCVCVPGAERYLRTDDNDGEVKTHASEQCTVYEYVYNNIDPKWMRN